MLRIALLLATSVFSLLSAEVIHLNGKNFDQIIDGSRNVLVKFEASWCGPCKAMTPILEAASKAYGNIDTSDTLIAAVDADEEDEIGERFQIRAFPTLKLFLRGKGQEAHIDYEGERSVQAFNDFINHYTAQNDATLPEEFKARPRSSVINILNSTRKIREVMNNVNPFLKAQRKMKKNNHNGLPHKQRNQPKQPKNPKQPHRPRNPARPVEEQRPRAVAQPAELIRDVSDVDARSIIASAGNRPVIAIFYSHSCPHCQEFLPIARTISLSRDDVIFIKIDGQKYYNYRDTFNLQFYPAIIGFKANTGGSAWQLLRGGRSLDNINNFINSLK